MYLKNQRGKERRLDKLTQSDRFFENRHDKRKRSGEKITSVATRSRFYNPEVLLKQALQETLEHELKAGPVRLIDPTDHPVEQLEGKYQARFLARRILDKYCRDADHMQHGYFRAMFRKRYLSLEQCLVVLQIHNEVMKTKKILARLEEMLK